MPSRYLPRRSATANIVKRQNLARPGCFVRGMLPAIVRLHSSFFPLEAPQKGCVKHSPFFVFQLLFFAFCSSLLLSSSRFVFLNFFPLEPQRGCVKHSPLFVPISICCSLLIPYIIFFALFLSLYFSLEPPKRLCKAPPVFFSPFTFFALCSSLLSFSPCFVFLNFSLFSSKKVV